MFQTLIPGYSLKISILCLIENPARNQIKPETYYIYYEMSCHKITGGKCHLWSHRCTSWSFCSVSSSGPSVRSVGEVQEAPDRLHQSAAPGAGEPVQTQQVPVQTQTLWSGHLTHADWNTGERESPSHRTTKWGAWLCVEWRCSKTQQSKLQQASHNILIQHQNHVFV